MTSSEHLSDASMRATSNFVRALIIASLVTNILVLLPVSTGPITHANWTLQSYGENTPILNIKNKFLEWLVVTSRDV